MFERHRRAGRAASRPSRAGSRARERAGRWDAPGSPQPHQRISAANDPLQRCPAPRRSWRPPRGARAARPGARTRKRRRDAGRSPQRLAQLDRHLRGGAVPAHRPAQGDLRLGAPEHARERRVIHLLGPHDATPARGVEELKSARTLFPLGLSSTSVKAPLDRLHPAHARPPAREMVGIAHDLPQLLCRRGDRAGATRGRHPAYTATVRGLAGPI